MGVEKKNENLVQIVGEKKREKPHRGSFKWPVRTQEPRKPRKKGGEEPKDTWGERGRKCK